MGAFGARILKKCVRMPCRVNREKSECLLRDAYFCAALSSACGVASQTLIVRSSPADAS
jgi:hypothetical protein